MWCVFKRREESNDTTYEIKYEFNYDSFEDFNNYDDVKNHFRNFTIDEEYENELKNEGYHSRSHILFYLCYADDSTFLFSATIEITDEHPIYTFNFKENDFKDFYIFLANYKGREDLYIHMNMYSKFYTQRSLTEEPEDDEDDEQIIPPIIENCFSSDNCTVCLNNKPNILNFPCLHLSLCEGCEKIGRFINCSICRKLIKRKVKI